MPGGKRAEASLPVGQKRGMFMATVRPGYFLPVAILFLLWNLMGDAAYLMQVTADLTALAKTDPYTARIWAAMPHWVWAAYALAVWLGTLGSIMLIMRRELAVPLYAVSLAGVLVQFGYSFLATDMIAVKGVATTVPFPAFIVFMAVVQLLFAHRMKQARVID